MSQIVVRILLVWISLHRSTVTGHSDKTSVYSIDTLIHIGIRNIDIPRPVH